MKKKILVEHLAKVRDNLVSNYNKSTTAQHGGIKGSAREGFIKHFLERNLPSIIEFKSGEIIDEYDNRSGQIDIVLQSSKFPRIHLYDDLQISLANAVVAAIEVKSDISSDAKFLEAINTFIKIKTLTRAHIVTPYMNLVSKKRYTFEHTNIPCFLIAYKGPKKPITLHKRLEKFKDKIKGAYNYFPEIIVVLNENYQLLADNGFLTERRTNEDFSFLGKHNDCLLNLFVYLNRLILSANTGLTGKDIIQYVTEIKNSK